MTDERITLTYLFAILGLISVLSLFILIPYTIGYFAYFGVKLMAFFSLYDFYFFSAFPVLLVNLAILGMAGIGYLGFQRGRLVEQGWKRNLKGFFLIFVAVTPIALIVAPIGIVLLTLIAVAVLLLCTFFQAQGISRLVVYLSIFLWVESFLFVWGNMVAMSAFDQGSEVTIVSHDKGRKGRAIFIGSNSILTLDADVILTITRLDSGATVTFPKTKNRRMLGCVEWKPYVWMRNAMHVSCK